MLIKICTFRILNFLSLNLGEGEYKIFQFIKAFNLASQNNMIVTNDSDLVIYSLANGLFKLKIISYEKPKLTSGRKCSSRSFTLKFNCLLESQHNYKSKDECPSNSIEKQIYFSYEYFNHLSIEKVYTYMMSIFEAMPSLDKDNLIRDIVLILILCGTDYVTALPYFETSKDWIKSLLYKYRNFLKSGIDLRYLTKDDGLNLSNFEAFIKSIKSYKSISEDKHKKLRKSYYQSVFKIENPDKLSQDFLMKVSSDYIKGIFWNLQVYYCRIVNWNHKMLYKFPLLIDDFVIDKQLDFDYMNIHSTLIEPLSALFFITPFDALEILPAVYKENLESYIKPETVCNHFHPFYHSNKIKIISTRIEKFDKIIKLIDKINKNLDKDKLHNIVKSIYLFKNLDYCITKILIDL